ncbi:alpha/beta hydrolase [Gluconacetobacter asukensis]|uniref:Alpha/beta hydrolase n=1 Tax=Gluconacetobacter asukensis TaxID=1017181 RepID=A0A7W4IYM2_9PROT|nr:alpha/beta hydrolase [Gluconacetobacter asukensis]MBB2171444.1 alpha/beta hydrolase [Gluconacetobacter asukensis]
MQICEGGRLVRDDFLCDPTGFAQLTPEQRARMRTIGACWNDDIVAHRAEMVALYSPLAAGAPKAAKVVRDIAYGPDARQVLDIFCPDGQEGARPVVVFIHGGAFTRGAKSANGEIYDNVLHWFARLGYVGVNVEYRLAPAVTWPDGAWDVLDALTWVRDSIAAHGGDPARVHVIGHSAGGSHLATAALEPGLGGLPAGVRSLALVSGRLRADRRPDNPNAGNVAAYFGPDESLYAARSPVSRAADCPLPVLVAVAEFENRHLDTYGAEFAHAVARAGRVPVRWVRLAGHNHTSIVAHLNTGEEGFGRALDAFFRLNDSVSVSERKRTGAS